VGADGQWPVAALAELGDDQLAKRGRARSGVAPRRRGHDGLPEQRAVVVGGQRECVLVPPMSTPTTSAINSPTEPSGTTWMRDALGSIATLHCFV